MLYHIISGNSRKRASNVNKKITNNKYDGKSISGVNKRKSSTVQGTSGKKMKERHDNNCLEGSEESTEVIINESKISSFDNAGTEYREESFESENHHGPDGSKSLVERSHGRLRARAQSIQKDGQADEIYDENEEDPSDSEEVDDHSNVSEDEAV